jgi:putative transposase
MPENVASKPDQVRGSGPVTPLGFVHLAAVVDWFSRKVLAWRLSITMEVAFCVEAVEDAMARFGKPEIFNTDQGSQFTSREFTAC